MSKKITYLKEVRTIHGESWLVDNSPKPRFKYKLKDFARGYYGKSKKIVAYTFIGGRYTVRIGRWICNGRPTINTWNISFKDPDVLKWWLNQESRLQSFTSIHEVIKTINKFIEDCGI